MSAHDELLTYRPITIITKRIKNDRCSIFVRPYILYDETSVRRNTFYEYFCISDDFVRFDIIYIYTHDWPMFPISFSSCSFPKYYVLSKRRIDNFRKKKNDRSTLRPEYNGRTSSTLCDVEYVLWKLKKYGPLRSNETLAQF